MDHNSFNEVGIEDLRLIDLNAGGHGPFRLDSNIEAFVNSDIGKAQVEAIGEDVKALGLEGELTHDQIGSFLLQGQLDQQFKADSAPNAKAELQADGSYKIKEIDTREVSLKEEFSVKASVEEGLDPVEAQIEDTTSGMVVPPVVGDGLLKEALVGQAERLQQYESI